MAEATIHGIEFEIKGNANSAADSLNKLATSLSKIKTVTSQGLGFGAMAKEIRSFNTVMKNTDLTKVALFVATLKKIGSVKISGRFARGLGQIGHALGNIKATNVTKLANSLSLLSNLSGKETDASAISGLRSDLEAISNLDFSNLSGVAKEIKEIAGASKELGVGRNGGGNHQWAASMTSQIESKDPGFLANAKEVTDTSLFNALGRAIEFVSGAFKSMGRSATESSEGVKKVAEEADKTAQHVSVLKKILHGLFAPIKLAAKGLKNLVALPFKGAIGPIKKFGGAINNIGRSIGRIAMYRLFRSIIKAITQALQEGTKNLYQYSKAIGGSFAANMDSAASSMLYFKNSIAAAWSPLMNLLAPALDAIVQKVVAAINAVNQLIAILSGASGWTRAIYHATEYEDAVSGAGGAAKEALKYLAPFDELNVLPSQKNGGGGGGAADDYGSMFEEMTSFADGIADFAKKIKEAIENADWQGLGTLLGDKINELVEKIDFAGIGKWIGEKINAWFTTKYWTLDTINFENIGAKIAEFFNNMLDNIDFEIIGRGLVQKFSIIGDMIIGAIENVDWKTVGSSIGDFLKGALNEASDWIKGTNFGELLESVVSGVFDFIEGLDPGDLALSILDLLGSVVGAIVDGLGTLLIDIADVIVDPDTWALVGAWIQDLPKKFQNAGIKAINAFVTSLTDGINRWIEKYNESPISDILGDIPPIKFNLIPEIPEDEINKNYNRVKAELEEKSKKDPVPINSSGHIVSINKGQYDKTPVVFDGKANIGKVNNSLTWDQRTFDSKAKFVKTVHSSLKDSQTTFDSKAKFIKTVKSSLTASQTTFDSKAKFVSVKDGLTAQQKTFNSKAYFSEKTVKPALQDGYGNITLTATAKITKITGQTSTTITAREKNGGVYQNGAWSSIPQFASGGRPHGSIFWAGEAGAEIVGHVNGRTEVLNRSQIASAIYSAVRSAMVGTTIRTDVSQGDYQTENEEAMYRAFSRALADSNLGGDIELDGDVLYRAIVNRNRRNTRMTGVNAMA